MIELADKAIKTVVITVIMSDIKNLLDQVNSRLDIAEENLVNF